MNVGVTERGDAGLDLSWYDKLDSVDGVVLITKSVVRPEFQEKILTAHREGHKIILHAGCTGWGGSAIEPGVPDYEKQLGALKRLIEQGFPIEQVVLRIDPIIPTVEGLEAVDWVIEHAFKLGILPGARVRISIYDEYPHVRERLRQRGFAPFYPYSFFHAPVAVMKRAVTSLEKWAGKLTFYTCAEKLETLTSKENLFIPEGCISERDLALLGLELPKGCYINGQQRTGCRCLAIKKELLTERHPCAHQCAYCYWKD